MSAQLYTTTFGLSLGVANSGLTLASASYNQGGGVVSADAGFTAYEHPFTGDYVCTGTLTRGFRGYVVFKDAASGRYLGMFVVDPEVRENPFLATVLYGQVAASIASPTVWTIAFTGDPDAASDDFYQGMVLFFISGALQTVGRKVASYAHAVPSFTVDEAFPIAPSDGDQFLLAGRMS